MTANELLVVVGEELMMPVGEVEDVCRAAACGLEIVSVADVMALGARLAAAPAAHPAPAAAPLPTAPAPVAHRGLRFWKAPRP